MLRPLIAAAFVAFTATAAMADATNEIAVAFGDLNLSRPADASILANRLRAAAKQVCLNVISAQYPTGIATDKAMRECMTSAIDLAVARIEGRLDKSVRASLATSRQNATTPELIGLKN